MTLNQMSFTIVTGLSGAGKTQAMKALEDLGYFCIDNLPPALLRALVDLHEKSHEERRFAVAIDVRGREYFQHLTEALDWLDENGYRFKIIFLECRDSVLVRRFSETRRAHPLQTKGSIFESIEMEKKLLADVRNRADVILDTSVMKPVDLKVRLNSELTGRPLEQLLTIDLFSFGYKYGAPIDADIIFDVRFVPNPYYIEEFKDKTGKDRECAEYILKDETLQFFIDQFVTIISRLIPQYSKEGKNRLTIGIGCTGGQHRSVATVIEINQRLKQKGFMTSVRHREV
ncbi:MAG: RNase adapter RapZ [Firmicutes bacterium]|nr:RNase adapter RapZ [Bacillota bacterium]